LECPARRPVAWLASADRDKGRSGERRRAGRPWGVGCEPDLLAGRPCDLPGCAASTNPSVSFARWSPTINERGGYMRSIGLDVHRDFCEVAIKERGQVRLTGRVRTSREELELFAGSLGREDRVVLEASGPALAVRRILEPHVAEVTVANPRRLRAIAESKVKTDQVDARTLCELLDAGFVP